MDRTKHLFWTFALALLLAACDPGSRGFVITGHIEGLEDGTLVTLYDLEQQVYLDSAFSKSEIFVLKGKVDQPTGCWIKCKDEYANIQVENLQMTYHAPLKDMHLNCTIEGGREQALQNEMQALQANYDEIYFGALDSLMNGKFLDEEHKDRLISDYRKNQSASHKIYIDFGKTHMDSWLGLNIVYRNRNSIPKDTLQLIYEQLTPDFKETIAARSLNIFLNEKQAQEGHPFIDFEAKDLDGNDFRLSSLIGKYIYLSFWSAGCGPCRMENKFLSRNYHRVPDDLVVVNFSTDKNAEVWEKASSADSIQWYNVSDLEGGQGSIKTRYGVQAIPNSFLIDRDGIVIKEYLGFDPDGDIIEELTKLVEGTG